MIAFISSLVGTLCWDMDSGLTSVVVVFGTGFNCGTVDFESY